MLDLLEVTKKLQEVFAEHGNIELAVEVEVKDELEVVEGECLTAFGSFFRGIEVRDDPGGKDGKYCVLIVSEDQRE